MPPDGKSNKNGGSRARRVRAQRSPQRKARASAPSQDLSRTFYEVVMYGTRVGSLSDKKLRLVRRILFLGRRWRHLLNEALRSTGDNHARWVTLLWVDLSAGRYNLAEIAKQIAVELPTLVRLLNRLEREGLLVRRALGDSNREKTVVLTAKGKNSLVRMSDVIDRTQAHFLEGLDLKQVGAALDVLDGVLARHANVIMWSEEME